MDISNFDFDLPQGLIASRPNIPRSGSKLLFYTNSIIKDYKFFNLPDLLEKEDLLIFNNTKVMPGLLFGYFYKKVKNNNFKKKFEFLLVKQINKTEWFCMCKPLKKIEIGSTIQFSNSLTAKIILKKVDGVIIKFKYDGNFFDELNTVGLMPIPPYIRKIRDSDNKDYDDYQSIFSEISGSIAAPTASLHFDNSLLDNLIKKNIKFCFVTLHVGLGTFNPIRTKNILNHRMHSEYGEISQETSDIINNTLQNGGRIIPVGTTSLRILETANKIQNKIKPFKGNTDIFISPGYKFKFTSGLITNFHLPKSSLFILVSSLVGIQNAKNIYSYAIKNNYRFFSYGDGSLLIK